MTSSSSKEPPLPSELQAQIDALSRQPWDDDRADLLADWKAVGNACYSRGCFLAAIRCYTKLLALPGGDTAAIRSNRSAAYLQSPMHAGPSLALKDAEKAVALEPGWFKAHVRVGDAQRLRGNVVEADVAYRQALALQPGCEGAQAGLRALSELLRSIETAAAPAPSASPGGSGASPAATPAPSRANATAAAAAAASGSGGALPRGETRGEGTSPVITPEQQIEGWKRETSVREDRTGMRPAPVSLAEADRREGVAIKQTLLANFRAKVETDEELSHTLRERHEEEVLRGDGVDYREADQYRRVYARATNGIGLGISADAYKEYTGRVDHRTW